MVKRISPTVKIANNDKVSFSFSNLKPLSYVDAVSDGSFFIGYLQRLSKLSQLGWSSIYTSPRHAYGSENLPVESLNERAKNQVPQELTNLMVLRVDSKNHAFLGYREGNVFQVLFIEHNFGEIYKHE